MLGRYERLDESEIPLFGGGGGGSGLDGGTVGGGPAFEWIDAIDLLEGVLEIGAGLAGSVPNSESCCCCDGGGCKEGDGCKE